jgi:hypothetical protein
MMSEWEDRVAAFWQSADDSKVSETLGRCGRVIKHPLRFWIKHN